ncbi:MAG TPA: efflux RND transporter periplasmic adaptor subunit [Gemmatimonadaceae bacterium]|nr:efflux RND transporter periplasmic adaptor subunit [Gemmatimonadaceae bacterium]
MKYRMCLATLVALAACKGGGGEEKKDVEPVVNAQTATAVQQSFTETVTAIGTVTPRPGHYAELAAPAPTRVAHIFVAPGDVVHEGDPLVEFERAPFDAAAQSARTALDNAEHAAQRAERLAAAGILARKDADQAQADLAQAKANAVTAERAQQLSTLRSPISGTVTRMSAILGASADPSAPVVAVADPAMLDIVFSLSPGDGAQVHAGNTIVLTSGRNAEGESLGQGQVAAVGATVDSASRGVLVRARLTHPARALRIGETVFGRIAVAVHPHAVVIPVQALVPDGDGLKVFVVESGHGMAQKVTVGGRTETEAEITDGVKAGDVVVTVGAYGMEDSAKVVPLRQQVAPAEAASDSDKKS